MPVIAGYAGQTFRMPLNLSGFQYNRNEDLLSPTALVEPTRNVNFHEGGIGKRGGSAHLFTKSVSQEMRGIFQFNRRDGNSYYVWAKADGKVYHTNDSNLIATGMSTSNFFHFSSFNNELYISDGASNPKYWDTSSTTNVTPNATWSSSGEWPIQMVPHSRGANARLWAITRSSVWASPAGNGHDFSSAIQIPVYSEDGLVGGFEFGGILFVFSKTKVFIIDDENTDTAYWGYQEAIWEGGAAHWRFVIKAGNNIYMVTREGLVYNIMAVQATGDYQSVNLARPSHIDRWIREKVSLSNIENFHCAYDRSQRAICFFFQVSGTTPNKVLKYFIDRPPDMAWVLHENDEYDSGLSATCSAEAEVATGQYVVITGDTNGQGWKLEQSARSDNDESYASGFKTIRMNMGNPLMWKRFARIRLRVKAQGNFNLTVRWWVDGERMQDRTLSLAGSGAQFDTAVFDTDVFAEDSLIPVEEDLGAYGYDVQFEIYNNNAGEDFFASELMVDFEECGVK